MSYDFNIKGHRFGFVATAYDKKGFHVLGSEAAEHFDVLGMLVSRAHQHGNESLKRLMVGAQGCLERLEAFLVQSKRMSDHNNRVSEQDAPGAGSMVAFRDTTALFDFETLLFHARALLDRLTFFIAKQIYRQDCDRPNKLRNLIQNFKKDHRVIETTKLIDETFPFFNGLMIGDGNLRSHLIHQSTCGENTTCAFTIHTPPHGKVIRFDYEVRNRPIIGTAWLLSKFITYFVMNTMAVYLNYANSVSLRDCEPIWSTNLYCFSDQVDPSEKGPRFSFITMNPSGVKLDTRRLKSSILE